MCFVHVDTEQRFADCSCNASVMVENLPQSARLNKAETRTTHASAKRSGASRVTLEHVSRHARFTTTCLIHAISGRSKTTRRFLFSALKQVPSNGPRYCAAQDKLLMMKSFACRNAVSKTAPQFDTCGNIIYIIPIATREGQGPTEFHPETAAPQRSWMKQA